MMPPLVLIPYGTSKRRENALVATAHVVALLPISDTDDPIKCEVVLNGGRSLLTTCTVQEVTDIITQRGSLL